MAGAGLPQAVNSSFFNALIIQTFLTGLHTILFAQATWTLLKKRNKEYLVLILTLLWILVIINLATTWDVIYNAFVIRNNSPIETVSFLLSAPGAVKKLSVISAMLAIVTADGLLAWRCCVLYEGNIAMIGAFALLIVTEIALIPPTFVAPSNSQQLKIQDSFFFITAGLTFIATSLIILRIVSVSRRSHAPFSHRKLVEILVESGLMYSMLTLATAVIEALVLGQKESIGLKNLLVATNYSSAFIPVAGIAPTLISVRIGCESEPTTSSERTVTSRPLSILQFRRSVPARGETSTFTGAISGAGYENNRSHVDSLQNSPTNVSDGEEKAADGILGKEEV